MSSELLQTDLEIGSTADVHLTTNHHDRKGNSFGASTFDNTAHDWSETHFDFDLMTLDMNHEFKPVPGVALDSDDIVWLFADPDLPEDCFVGGTRPFVADDPDMFNQGDFSPLQEIP